MEPGEFDDLVEEPFKVPDLAIMWNDIMECHRNMGFQMPLTDKEKGNVLTDNEVIKEFQWIYGQYRKYIGTRRGQLLPMRGDLHKMLANIKDLIEKDSETPEDRTKLVYQTMRNQWLINTWNQVAWIIEQMQEEEENG